MDKVSLLSDSSRATSSTFPGYSHKNRLFPQFPLARSEKIRQSTSCSIEQSPLRRDFFAVNLLRGARLCIIQKQDSCGDRMIISQVIVVQSSCEKEYHEGKALRICGDSSLLSLRTSSLHRDGSSRSQKKPYSLRCWAHRWY